MVVGTHPSTNLSSQLTVPSVPLEPSNVFGSSPFGSAQGEGESLTISLYVKLDPNQGCGIDAHRKTG